MSLWSRRSSDAEMTAATLPELEELARLIPERDTDSRFFWQPFVERIVQHFDGLPAPNGGASLVRECLAAGCRAVPVSRRNGLWKGAAPSELEHQEHLVYEFRVRLGLFFAAGLRYLVSVAARARVSSGETRWQSWGETCFGDFLEAVGGELDITWSKAVPAFGERCMLADAFFPPAERELVSFPLAREVLAFLDLDDSAGLFGMMLFDDGQVEKVAIDVADVFLEGLRKATRKGYLRVNRVPGELFVADGISFLVAPSGVNVVLQQLRKAGYDFKRNRILVYEVLTEQGLLVGVESGQMGTFKGVLRGKNWAGTVELLGLPIATDALWVDGVPSWIQGGDVVITRKEGEDTGNGRQRQAD